MRCKYCSEIIEEAIEEGWHNECKEEFFKIMEFHKILNKYYGVEEE